MRAHEKVAVYNPGREPSSEISPLDPDLGLSENKCCLRYPVYNILLCQPEQTNTSYSNSTKFSPLVVGMDKVDS